MTDDEQRIPDRPESQTCTEGEDSILAALLDELTTARRRGQEPDLQLAERRYPALADDLRSLWATVWVAEEMARSDWRDDDPKGPLGPVDETVEVTTDEGARSRRTVDRDAPLEFESSRVPSRPSFRRLRAVRGTRTGWDGDRRPGDLGQGVPGGRAQTPPERTRVLAARCRAVPSRDPCRRVALAPLHRAGIRPGRMRRPALLHDEVRRGDDPGSQAGGWPDDRHRGFTLARSRLPGDPVRSRQRGTPPRPQAFEYPDRSRREPLCQRLRAGQAHRRRSVADPFGGADRYAELHGPRASGEPGVRPTDRGRAGERRLQPGCDLLSHVDRPTAVSGGHARRDDHAGPGA